MPTFYDSSDQPYTLGKRLGSGGEGTVYACDDNFQIVAKIYHERVTREKAEKLKWMAAHQDERLLKVAAWVIDVLYDAPNGKVVGFLMPNIRAKEIHELYSLKSRRVHFPEATWHFLIHAAANLARAFHLLHKNSHVMGDVNHGNCVVLADGTVKLIDCDSYSISTEKLCYPCEVGVTTHLAPELQGINLRGIVRVEKHDNFGLAVIIFQLLFLGRHPFAGNFIGGEDKTLEEAIKDHLFAYGREAKRKLVAQPPGTLSLSAVSPKVANLFERAFTKDYIRPEPKEWIEALEDLADSLEQCTLHPGHLFYEKVALCPWCEIESETGLMLFPFVITDTHLKAKYQKTFDIVTVENLIESFKIDSNLPVKLSENLAPIAVAPIPSIINEQQQERIKKGLVCSAYFVGLCICYFMFGGICAFVLSFVAVVILYAKFNDIGKMVRVEAYERLLNLQNKWALLEKEWIDAIVSPNLTIDLAQIKKKLDDYRGLQIGSTSHNEHETDKDLTAIENTHQSDQTLSDAKDTHNINHIEYEISSLISALRSGSVRLRREKQSLLAKSQNLARELAQSQSNVKYLGNNFPIGIILILITIIVPVFTSIIPSFIFQSRPLPVSSRLAPPPTPSRVITPVPVTNGSSAEPVKVPDEKITDREIASISLVEKSLITRELIRQSNVSVDAKTYDNAERLLKFAQRFDSKDTAVLISLGNLFYEQKKYDQSLVYYNRAKSIVNDETTNFLIGITLLNMTRYSEAKDIFVKLTNGGLKSNESYYNLGAAYQGLKDYKSALEAFKQAVKLNQKDTDSIYQIGICLNKLGDKDGVREYYKILLEKNADKAENFKRAVGKSVNLDTPPDVYYGDRDETPPVASSKK